MRAVSDKNQEYPGAKPGMLSRINHLGELDCRPIGGGAYELVDRRGVVVVILQPGSSGGSVRELAEFLAEMSGSGLEEERIQELFWESYPGENLGVAAEDVVAAVRNFDTELNRSKRLRPPRVPHRRVRQTKPTVLSPQALRARRHMLEAAEALERAQWPAAMD